VVTTTEPIRRGDVFLVNLDPTRGAEIKKTRPCVIVSPDESSRLKKIRFQRSERSKRFQRSSCTQTSQERKGTP